MADKYALISGASVTIGGIACKQPTLGDIFKIAGYQAYSSYLYMMGMTLEKFLSVNKMADRFHSLPPEVQQEITLLDVITIDPYWRTLLLQALSFFIKDCITYDEQDRCLMVETVSSGAVRMTEKILSDLRQFVFQSACMESPDAKSQKFYNKAAQRLYEKSQKIKAAQAKNKTRHDESMEMWNVIGAVCVKHPSYNLTNIWDLTVYQLYDQFFRLQGDVQFNTIAHRWAVWGKDQFDFSLWFKKGQTNQ